MHYKFLVYCCCILNEWNLAKKRKRKLLAEMYSKHRKYSKSSNKFNKETRILIISCIIGSVYPIECFHMTSRRPYWCPITMKRRPCWCSKPSLRELNSFLMQTLSFVPINLHICWPREWKHSINATLTFLHVLYMCTILAPLTYTYTIYSHTTGHWCGFFYVLQEPDTNENAVRRNVRFFVLNLSVRTRTSNRLQMP